MGGLSKKSYTIKNILKQRADQALVLDAGNLLFKNTAISDSQELITAAGIMEIYKDMAYDAVAVGPYDLAAGLAFLQETQIKGFPWLSANIVDEQNNPIFLPSKKVERAGLKIGLVGLSDREIPTTSGIKVIDWEKALAEQLVIIGNTCDLIVVLTSLPDQDNAELMRLFPQVHILLTANRAHGNIMPRIVNNTLVTQTNSQGKYLGVLDVDWQASRAWEKNVAQEMLTLQDRLGVLGRQILRAERMSNRSVASEAQLQAFRQERETLLQTIKDAETKMAKAELQKNVFNSFKSSFIALNTEAPDDPQVAERVSNIKEQVNNSNKQMLTGSRTLTQENQNGEKERLGGFAGSARCSSCHVAQAEFWSSTGHAVAFQSLVQQSQGFNLDCLPCHVTHGVKDMLKDAKKMVKLAGLPPEMRGVGCESCHGSGENHASNPNLVNQERKVGESVCLQCHTEERSPSFSFLSALSQVSCPK